MDLDALAERSVKLCKTLDWDLGWEERGCYLHLEASELIEAVRGKGDSTVTEEAGDVLFVLLTILNTSDVKFDEVAEYIESKIAGLEADHLRRTGGAHLGKPYNRGEPWCGNDDGRDVRRSLVGLEREVEDCQFRRANWSLCDLCLDEFFADRMARKKSGRST